MDLPSDQLNAALAVAQSLNFGQAAVKLQITQSALSQRIQKLERLLGTTLFLRNNKSVQLTPAAHELVRYGQIVKSLEVELLANIQNQSFTLSGTIRIGAYSSVLSSVIMPALQDLIKTEQGIKFEFVSAELRELEDLLVSGKVDFVVSPKLIERADLTRVLVGKEEQVLITPKSRKTSVYLDHDPEDMTTYDYFTHQGWDSSQLERSFVGNIQNIITGVELGLGNAIVSKHLIKENQAVVLKRVQKKLNYDVYLYQFQRPYSSKLFDVVRAALMENCKKLL